MNESSLSKSVFLDTLKSKKRIAKQFLFYVMVGLGSNLVAYCTYLIITAWGYGPKISMTFVYLVGVVIGFLGNSKWTFEYSEDKTNSAMGFLLAHFLGYILNFVILVFFVDMLGYSHQLIQFLAIVAVACFVFIILKFFVFTKVRCE